MVDQKSGYQDIADQIGGALRAPTEIIISFDIIDTVNRIVFDKIDLVFVDASLLSQNDYRRNQYFLNKTENIPVVQMISKKNFDELNENDQLPKHFIVLEKFSDKEILNATQNALTEKFTKISM